MALFRILGASSFVGAAAIAAVPGAKAASFTELTYGGEISSAVADYEVFCLVSGCAPGSRAIIDATVSTANQGVFSKEIATSSTNNSTGVGTGSNLPGNPINISEIPVADVLSIGPAFRFVFDAKETGGNPGISLTNITIRIDNTLIWQFQSGIVNIATAGDPPDNVTVAPISMNNGIFPSTATPRGTGADLALFIPLTTVVAAGVAVGGFTGGSALEFSWVQTNADNGEEQWIFTGQAGDFFFDPEDPVDVIPLPAALPLFATAIAGLIWTRRRRAPAG